MKKLDSLCGGMARLYASNGYPVIPLHSITADGTTCTCGKVDCSSPGKHPRTKHGFKDASCDVRQVNRWFHDWSNSNIGMPTGSAGVGIVVDVDPRHGGDDSLAELEREHGPLPPTLEARTGGGGRHIIFRGPAGATIANSTNVSGYRGIDIRGNGGYIVVPPSRHASGGIYRWREGRGPGDIEPVPMPTFLVDLCRNGKPTHDRQTKTVRAHASEIDTPGIDKIEEGIRNDTLFRIGCSLRWKNLSPETIEAALQIENEQRCSPPLPECEVSQIALSASRYAPGDRVPDEQITRDLAEATKAVAGLAEKAKADPGVVFEHATATALAVIERRDPGGWARLRDSFKKAGLGVQDLKRAAKGGSKPNLRVVRSGETQPGVSDDVGDFREVDGRYVQGEDRCPLSNWTARPVERLVTEDGDEVLRLEARLVGAENTVTWDLPAGALASSRDLIKALPSTEWAWLGKDYQVQILRIFWRNLGPVPNRQATRTIGRHLEKEGGGRDLIVLTDHCYTADGPVENSPITVVARGALPFQRAVRPPWADPETVTEVKRAVAQFLGRVNHAFVMVMVVGWLGALPWAVLFKKLAGKWEGFPHLVIGGTQGGGKTSLGEILWRLWGVCGMEPLSLPKTRFTRLLNYSSSNLFPVWFDEYKISSMDPYEIKQIAKELRSVYGGETDERGQANLTVRSFSQVAPVAVTGESVPSDTALKERIFQVTPDPELIKPEGNPWTAAYQALHEVELEAFALSYATWALRRDDWLKGADEARTWVRSLLAHVRYVIPPRAVNNLAIAMFGLGMLEEFLETPVVFSGADVPAALVHQVETLFPDGRRRTALDELLVLAASRAHAELHYGQHWVVSGSKVTLRLDAVVADLRKFVRQSGHPTEILGEEAYRRFVQEQAGKRDSYVTSSSGNGKFEGGRVLRGVVLDRYGLEAGLGIDSAVWDEIGGDE